MRTILVLSLFLISFGVCAQNPAESECEEYGEADDQLNDVYQEIMSAHADDDVFTDALREAQRAWLAFRDAHMAARYPSPSTRPFGSFFQMCWCIDMEELTRSRVAQLRAWLDTDPAEEVCMGSYGGS